MSAAVFDQATILINAVAKQQSSTSAQLRVSGSVLKFAGWKKLFPVQDDVTLPAVTEGQQLQYQDLQTAQKFTLPPARYNDASLVKELENAVLVDQAPMPALSLFCWTEAMLSGSKTLYSLNGRHHRLWFSTTNFKVLWSMILPLKWKRT